MPIHECPQLLDICGPDVYRRNAFRLLAADVDHKSRQIKRAEKELTAAIAVDDLAGEYSDAFRPDPLPTREELSQAGRDLADAQKRFIHEFFWFWPLEWGESDSDEVLNLLKANKAKAAQQRWQQIAANGSPASLVARHNLAVLGHWAALDREHAVLSANGGTEPTLDQRKEFNGYWTFAFKYWKPLCTDESLWSMLSDRIRALNDPRLTTGFVRRMCESLPIALNKILAELAVAYCDRKIYVRARDHVQIMRATNAGAEGIEASLRRVTKTLHDRVDHAIETATARLGQNKTEGKQRCIELFNTVRSILNVFQVLLGTESQEYRDTCDRVAESMVQCQVVYGNETEDWNTSVYLLEATLKVARGAKARARVEENLRIVRNNRQGDICWFCERRSKDEKHCVTVTLKKPIRWREIKANPEQYRDVLPEIAAQAFGGLNLGGMFGGAGDPHRLARGLDAVLNDSAEIMTQQFTTTVPRCGICAGVHSRRTTEPIGAIQVRVKAAQSTIAREAATMESLRKKIAALSQQMEGAWFFRKWQLSSALKPLREREQKCKSEHQKAKKQLAQLQAQLEQRKVEGVVKPFSHREAWPAVVEAKGDGFHIS
jgi:hypothetical protein